MLLQFSVENYRSFKNKATLSMLASSSKDLEENVFTASDKTRLLKSATIYGANASGKSNLLTALGYFLWFIRNSVKMMNSEDAIEVQPFLFAEISSKEPTSFEIVFILDGIQFRYGVSLTRSQVLYEYLFGTINSRRESTLFIREEQTIEVNSKHFQGGKTIASGDYLRKNALFLSVADQFNIEQARKIFSYFITINVISSVARTYYEVTVDMIRRKSLEMKLINFLKFADIQIEDILISEIDTKESPKSSMDNINNSDQEQPKNKVIIETFHKVFDKDGKFTHNEKIDFRRESAGTRKLFGLFGPIFDTLEKGGVLFIDELDSSIHPVILEGLSKLFNSNLHNNKKAQIIFTSQCPLIMRSDIFRRDQIWFCEKSPLGESELYSLLEYKVRTDKVYSKNYLQGKYGAIPFVDPDFLFN